MLDRTRITRRGGTTRFPIGPATAKEQSQTTCSPFASPPDVVVRNVRAGSTDNFPMTERRSNRDAESRQTRIVLGLLATSMTQAPPGTKTNLAPATDADVLARR